MRPSRIILSSVLLSTLIALIISYLPGHVLSTPVSRDVVSVFQWKIARPISISDENLVDFMKSQSLHQTVDYVEWSSGRLSIDLVYNGSVANQSDVYVDFKELIQNVFLNTDNVDFLLLRFLDDSLDERPLALSVLVSRKDALNKLHKLGKLEAEQLESFLVGEWKMKETQHWKKQ